MNHMRYHARISLLSVLLFIGWRLSAQAQLNQLENFTPTGTGSNFRQNSYGADAWAAFVGEDPDQTYAWDNSPTGCQNIACFKNVGSNTDRTIYVIDTLTPGNPTTIHITTPAPSLRGASGQTFGSEMSFVNVIGTGCAAVAAATVIDISAVVNSQTFQVALDSTGCNFVSGGFQATCAHGCGQYWNFYPYPYVDPYNGLNLGFTKDYILSGTWSATDNRLYYRYMCNKNVPQGGYATMADNVQLGNYETSGSGSYGTQGNHYYDSMDLNVYANRWSWVMMNNQKDHEVSMPGAMRPTIDEGLWNGDGHLWLSGLTRWYFNSGGDPINGMDKWSHSTCWVADVRVGEIDQEPDEWVSNLGVTYSGPIPGYAQGRYELYWQGPPETNLTYTVKYSTAGSMHTSGFNTGTALGSGTSTSTGNDDQDVYLTSANMSEAPHIWIGIRPTMPLVNAVTISGKTVIQTGGNPSPYGILAGSDLRNGDQITVSNVGGCVAANGTWNVTLTPHKVFSISGGSLSQVAVSNNVATATTTSPHGLVVGQMVQVYRVDGGEAPSAVTPVLSTPTSNTFTYSWAQVNGTYTASFPDSYGNLLSIHAGELVSLNGSNGCNSPYTSGGTMVATSNTTNFTEIEIDQVSGGGTTGLSFSRCDLNEDGAVNALDVQLDISAAVGLAPTLAQSGDLNGDGVVNVLDVEILVNAVLGGTCSAGS